MHLMYNLSLSMACNDDDIRFRKRDKENQTDKNIYNLLENEVSQSTRKNETEF